MAEKDQPTVLVVDDEKKMRTMVSDYLEAVGYEVISASNGKEAVAMYAEKETDIILLDLMMPVLDGIDAARRIRRESSVPIIMLTARAEEQDKLLGLDLGADDYMVKPFSLKELDARIRAVLRRTAAKQSASQREMSRRSEDMVSCRDVVVDRERRRVQRGDESIRITGAQFEILSHLVESPGRVFSRMQLLDLLQDHAYEGYERTIDVHIKNLRKALEPDPATPVYIKTVWGIGYKFEDEEADSIQ